MSPTSEDKLDVLSSVRTQKRPRSEGFHLGERLRHLRRERGMTLEDVGRRTGLAASTLSKIENDQMSPTFDVVQKLAVGLDIDITELFASNSGQDAAGRRSVTLSGTGRLMETEVYRHRLIAAELKNKKILPFVTTIKARSAEDFKTWSQHSGEEFLYVLKGEICFQTEHYEPAILGVGDSIYINSNMEHACYSTSEEDAVVLWVNTA
ncbi:helix-turn-helix domain-containing protein [Sphingosinicella sp. BN140058]|uniref:helix-turn-helix domain-containing protein n=1 Tax=Sphingosinicella sp. BN140058 TaxID=1892855 RepID=UPI001011F777|nr:XRE family transcriptional regulator [Sphingosinicella sp. BN140058]QAY75464.1 cupin domain-containing protein [Sphingosinicella sp. BN140058]